jgi:hypothetical protein
VVQSNCTAAADAHVAGALLVRVQPRDSAKLAVFSEPAATAQLAAPSSTPAAAAAVTGTADDPAWHTRLAEDVQRLNSLAAVSLPTGNPSAALPLSTAVRLLPQLQLAAKTWTGIFYSVADAM